MVTNDAEEKAYLRAHFGEAVSGYRLARFYLMRQLLHMFCPAVLFMFGLKGNAVHSKEKVPDFRDFHNRIWKGELSRAADEAKLQYAKVHMKQNLEDMGGTISGGPSTRLWLACERLAGASGKKVQAKWQLRNDAKFL